MTNKTSNSQIREKRIKGTLRAELLLDRLERVVYEEAYWARAFYGRAVGLITLSFKKSGGHDHDFVYCMCPNREIYRAYSINDNVCDQTKITRDQLFKELDNPEIVRRQLGRGYVLFYPSVNCIKKLSLRLEEFLSRTELDREDRGYVSSSPIGYVHEGFDQDGMPASD